MHRFTFKIITLLSALLLNISVSAQNHELNEMVSYPNSSIRFNWYYNAWSDFPKEIEQSPLSMGVDLYSMIPLVGKKTWISLASGIGVGVNNLKMNAYLQRSHPSENSKWVVLPDSISYSVSKLSAVYVDVPFEIRLRTRPRIPSIGEKARKRNIRLDLGAKIGILIHSYTKYKGEDYRNSVFQEKVKFKEYEVPILNLLRYSVYSSLGYGKFSLYAYYSLSPFFDKDYSIKSRTWGCGISIQI